ncbi:MAG: N-acetylmuramoyl-L-alanine amidase [Chitinophagaceae bacterium]|nr:N-acetylmuramoyl-L-alanine amidase [Chitinophagaceae bacterium]
MSLNITDKILEKGEYVEEKFKKTTIYLHHTAGSHRADWTIEGWNKDRTATNSRLRVATAFVIGGLDRTGSDKDGMDGKIYRAYNEDFWASHLGLKTANNNQLNRQSIGIEICNYGPVTKTNSGKYLNYVNSELSPPQVCDLGYLFKGYRFHHKYTDKQIASLKELLLFLGGKYGIDLKKGLVKVMEKPLGAGFDLNNDALNGKPGIWSHTSVRKDKFDVHPQAELVAMLKTLN